MEVLGSSMLVSVQECYNKTIKKLQMIHNV